MTERCKPNDRAVIFGVKRGSHCCNKDHEAEADDLEETCQAGRGEMDLTGWVSASAVVDFATSIGQDLPRAAAT